MDGIKRINFLPWLGRILLLILLTVGLSFLIRALFHGIARFSSALVLIGLLEVIAAGSALYNHPSESSGTIWLRFLVGVPPNENRDERLTTFWTDMFAKQTFAGQVLLCGLVTVVAAVVVSVMNM